MALCIFCYRVWYRLEGSVSGVGVIYEGGLESIITCFIAIVNDRKWGLVEVIERVEMCEIG